MTKIIFNEEAFTRSKKTLKHILFEKGLDINLSTSGQIISKTFGYKDEHELQQQFFKKPIDIIQPSIENNIRHFYFLELLSLYKETDKLLLKKIHTINNNPEHLNYLIDCKCRVSTYIKFFEIDQDAIILGVSNELRFMKNCVRYIYNKLVEISYDTKNTFLTNEEKMIVKHLYNYHNIEPWFLRKNQYKNSYYLSIADFESELIKDNHELKFNNHIKSNIQLEIYKPNDQHLYVRKLCNMSIEKTYINIDQFDSSSFLKVKCKYSFDDEFKFIRVV